MGYNPLMLQVSLRRLEVLVMVAEAGGFAAAASRLGIAQPSVSAHIQALEEATGLVLVERRRGRSGRLSAAGEAFLDHARAVLSQAEQLGAGVRERRQATRAQVILACQRMVANSIFPSALAAFACGHEKVQLVIRTLTQAEVIDQVLGGAADLACFLSNAPPAALNAAVIGRERFLLVVGPGHALAGRVRLAPAEIARHPFVRADQGSHLGRELDRLLAAAGITEVQVAARTTEYPVGRELAAAGAGVLLALERSAQPDLESGRLVALELDAPAFLMDLCLALSPRRLASPAVQEVAALLRRSLPRGDALPAPARRLRAPG